MPCPRKDDKTLAAHIQHLEMPCQDSPSKIYSRKKLLGARPSKFGKWACLAETKK